MFPRTSDVLHPVVGYHHNDPKPRTVFEESGTDLTPPQYGGRWSVRVSLNGPVDKGERRPTGPGGIPRGFTGG